MTPTMSAIATVAVFPLLMALFYGVLFAAARSRGGMAGIARMSALAPHLFPLPLALPLAVIAETDFGSFGFWLQSPSPAWILAGIGSGMLLFFGEAGWNRWRANRSAHGGSGGLDGFVFVPWLAPFQSLVVVAMEESIWRGFLIGGLTASLHCSIALAVLASSLLFSLHHVYFGVATAAYKGGSALVWGALLIASGSLWVCFAAHLSSDLLVWQRLIKIARRQAAGDSSMTPTGLGKSYGE